MSVWKKYITTQFTERKNTQYGNEFCLLVSNYTALVQSAKSRKTKIFFLESQMEELKSVNNILENRLTLLKDNSNHSPTFTASSKKVAELEEKYMRCQEELTEIYKSRSLNA
eukprot:Sdes_comp26389_c0_seq1m22933